MAVPARAVRPAAVYPSPLPFDAPVEQPRRLFEVWDGSLPAALDVFGTPAAARREWLRLDATELSILTDVAFRELPDYFGEAPRTTIAALNAVVANAKTFCRRMDITS